MDENNTFLYVMETIVGTPDGSYEHFALYLSACVVSLLMVFFVPYIFKLVISMFNVSER